MRTRRLRLHWGRNALHVLGGSAWFYGLGHLPLAQVFAIEFTMPVWGTVLACVVLGERLTPPRALALAAGFAGVWLILRPGLGVMSWPALAVLGGAVAYAGSYICTKRLSATESPLAVVFYMMLLQLPLCAGPALIGWHWPSPLACAWLSLVASTTLAAHLCITRALRLVDTIIVLPLDFLRLPLIAAVGYLWYQEPVDWWLFAGAGLMLCGNLQALVAERRTPPLPQAAGSK